MKVVCEHCGLPFTVARTTPGRAVYCCSGCALAARVPVDASGQFPVNAALVTALSVGFAAFNQVLFWLLGVLLARRAGAFSDTASEAPGADLASAENAARFAWASLGVGAVVWISLAVLQWRVGARRAADLCVLALGLAGVVAGLALRQPTWAALGNALVIAWSLRGLRRKRGGA